MSLIYNILFVILLILAFLEHSGNVGKNKLWFYGIVMGMLLTAGLAYGISPDWKAYWNAFEWVAVLNFSDIAYVSEQSSMEIGYIFMNKVFSTIGFGYGGMVFFLVAIMLLLKTNTIYKYGGFVFFSLLLYFMPNYFFEEHVHIRQGMAVGISLYSVRYVLDRKFWKFLICIIIAFQFHKSVIVFLPAYWLILIDFKISHIIVLVLFAIIAQITGLSILLDSVVQLLPFGVSDKFNDYESALGATGGVALGDVVKVLTIIAIVIYDKSAKDTDEYYIAFRNLFIVGVIMFFFFGKGIFGIRLPSYYTVYFIFVAPRLVKGISMPSIKHLVFGVLTLYVILLYFRFYQVQGARTGYGNYKTIFNEESPYSFFLEEL